MGKYYSNVRDEMFDESRGVIKIRTKDGVAWYPLIYTGWESLVFDDDDTVVILILDDSHIYLDDEERVANNGIAFIIKTPPHMIGKELHSREDEANMPTKLLGGSSSSSMERHVGGTDGAKIVATDDMLLLKGPNGNQIAICNDGIVSRGKKVELDFFNTSKFGAMKENWVASVLPQSVLVALEMLAGQPMPQYLPDTSILDRIAGIGDIV